MVPMRGWKTVGTFHEPSRLRVADPRSGPRLCEAQRFMVPMRAQKRKEALHESGGARLRRALISDGYKLGLDGVSPHRSSPQLTSSSWRCSLSMNRRVVRERAAFGADCCRRCGSCLRKTRESANGSIKCRTFHADSRGLPCPHESSPGNTHRKQRAPVGFRRATSFSPCSRPLCCR